MIVFDIVYDFDMGSASCALFELPDGRQRLMVNPAMTAGQPFWLRETLVRSMSQNLCNRKKPKRAGLAEVIDICDARALRSAVAHTGTSR